MRLSAAAALIWINAIGGHLARDLALGEIGPVALQALERIGGVGAAIALKGDIITFSWPHGSRQGDRKWSTRSASACGTALTS